MYFLIYWFSVYTFLVIISQRLTLRPDRSGFDLLLNLFQSKIVVVLIHNLKLFAFDLHDVAGV